nr:leucine-rich repeat protein [Tanacetum cinerariifolium]
MVETHTPKKQKKRVQEQINIQVEEIANIHAEEELQQMIAGLDRSNEIIAKHLEEYDQAAAELTIREMIELFSELVKYQDHHSKILRNNLGWKVKDFKGMSFEEVDVKFKTIWEQIKGGVSKIPKGEAAWLKRKGIRSEQESTKKQKTTEEVHTEGQRSYWKITRLGGSSANYQFFIDMLKQIDRDDLNQLWSLVKETLSIRPATDEKEMELWVELKRLFEPDVEDHLWTHTQHIKHAPVEWRLYDTCEVHHVMFKDLEIFMLVEKNYPLRKAFALVMICNKL